MYWYANFIAETNDWWLRRLRPVWLSVTLAYAYFIFHRYYFFGKEATLARRKFTDEQRALVAKNNKRQFGYGHFYKPTYERSIKKQVMELLGDDYDYAFVSEERYNLPLTFDECIDMQKEDENY